MIEPYYQKSIKSLFFHYKRAPVHAFQFNMK